MEQKSAALVEPGPVQVVAAQPLQLSRNDIIAHVRLVQEVMEAVMKQDVHYGVIPGTKRQSLWKPGAEVLGMTFRVAPSYDVQDLSTEDCIRYRVFCTGKHQLTEMVLGEGAGACSSHEEKYKWRRAVNKAEWNATPENRRRVKYGRGRDGDYTTDQVRTAPEDLDNTILKMACKRAQIAMIINVTAASDIFSQDLEDLPAEIVEEMVGEPPVQPVQPPKAKSEAGKSSPATPAVDPAAVLNVQPIGPGPRRLIEAKLKAAALTDADLCKKFNLKTIDDLLIHQLNDVFAWIANPNGGAS